MLRIYIYLIAKIVFFAVRHKFLPTVFKSVIQQFDNQCVAKVPVSHGETGTFSV